VKVGAALVDGSQSTAYIPPMTSSRFEKKCATAEEAAAIDMLVLATVNAPYRRSISAAALADSIASTDINEWLVHVANFFTSLRPALVFEFAASHGISNASVGRTYDAVSRATGMRNPDLEIALGSVAAPAQ
jgi:hypothetical protein